MDTKASFVVVAAGVLASATGLTLVRPETLYLGLVPFALTIATVVVSTVALWPRSLHLPSGRQIVDTWVDADISPERLEDMLLEVKAQEVHNRDTQNEMKASWTKWGFVLLIASLVSALSLVPFNATLVKTGDTHVGNPSPAATP